MKNYNKQPHVCIIGGGAAGLSAGYFLTQQGYKNITILEKENQIGGKCMSITVGGKSFDLGANYVTSNYKQVKRLALKFKADLYTEGKLKAFDTQKNEFSSLFKTVLKQSSFFKLSIQSIRFLYKRWRLNSILSPNNPGFKGIASHPSLCLTFEDWLQENNLSDLAVLFQVPISLMGYGQLSRISAAYALKYMCNSTFLDLLLSALNPNILGYPKRFTEGYQRLWERVSWTIDTIEIGATVTSITRGNSIKVSYSGQYNPEHLQQAAEKTLTCDYLIVAVPLYLQPLQAFMTDMTEQEKTLFSQVVFDPFIVTTYNMPHLESFTAATFLIPEPEKGQPFVVTRQFEDNDLVSIYTRGEVGKTVDKDKILANNAAFVKKATGLELCDYYTYNEFPYFPHVTHDKMANGFYDQLEAIQGQQNTFYVGGLMNFELVEMIVNYSKHLIETNFPKL